MWLQRHREATVNWPGLSRVGARCHSDKDSGLQAHKTDCAFTRNGSGSRSLLSRELIAR